MSAHILETVRRPGLRQAQRITSEAQALQVAAELAAEFAQSAAAVSYTHLTLPTIYSV